MLKRTGVLLVMLVMLAAPGVASAKNRGATAKNKSYQSHQSRSATSTKQTHGSPWAHERGWAHQARGKLGFGLKNTLLGWTEFFTEPYKAAKGGQNVAGGIGRGLWNGLADTVGGAAHLVTFPITKLDLPLPEGGV